MGTLNTLKTLDFVFEKSFLVGIFFGGGWWVLSGIEYDVLNNQNDYI